MTPKQEFLRDVRAVKRHQNLVDDENTRQFLLAAYNEYTWQLPGFEAPLQSQDANSRRKGAKEFIEVFLNLSRKPTTPHPDNTQLEKE
jgi:hypothetical protein